MLKITLITTLAAILSIGLHFTALLLTTKILAKFHGIHPISIVFSLMLAVFAHLLEILIFAGALQYMYLHSLIAFSLADPHFLDIFYFSGTTYTTVGYGDIVLIGPGRTIAVVESLMGLVLIAWTASFTYYEMNRKWTRNA
ncbi:MAG: two pore domain potassium channel family protein [Proteobacteria bacterium]|nr:two pore domain potassium channel family protein [Pseudomonadota bacterium]NOG61675.1 two pore domain potassium channel family protein [Pseudomonadota bacterium]